MASNFFGNIFRITTFGESHGLSMGVVIDGCPSGIPITPEEIDDALRKRMPGQNPFVSPRKEKDHVEIISGVFSGITTGAPICLLIKNTDSDPSAYEPIKDLLRPGHANFTYLSKYKIFDYRGGGRASARETVCRVAAGAIAEKIIAKHKIQIVAYVYQVGTVQIGNIPSTLPDILEKKEKSSLFCPCEKTSQQMERLLKNLQEEGDSVGGIIAFIAEPMPVGLGDPVYEKLEANLAKAMLSIPAAKGFEIGEGFSLAKMKGSQANDIFTMKNGRAHLATNHAGGVLGGISSGMPLFGKVAFKPTSSILKEQKTIDLMGKEKTLSLIKGRHDPCVAIRAAAVVEAMVRIVLADAILTKEMFQNEHHIHKKSFKK